jgi:peptidoglycan/LPS O-acetylase OafA/YrhL
MNHDMGREAPGHSLARTSLPVGALRSVLTLLVVAHHAFLAYHPWAPPAAASLTAEPRSWLAFPIVDAQRAPGLDLVVGWNDTFFMSLLFLLAGAVAWPSLVRRGAGAYFRARLVRLGLPFLFAAGLVAPFAYLPTYLAALRHGAPQPGSFVAQWLALGTWPAGPAWFLWVLLALGGAAAVAYRVAPRWGERLGRWTGGLSQRPVVYLLALCAVSAAAYLPLAGHFRPETWVDFGPFWIQIGRALHYAVYFAAGVGLGAHGLDRGLLDPAGRLARRWPLWSLSAALTFALAVAAFLKIIGSFATGGPSLALSTFGNFTFVLCCATTSLAMLALFVRFAQRPSRPLIALGASAYGIYLLHYAAVSWLQLGLLDRPIPGLVKALLVFAGAVAASWGATAQLRRIPGVSRVL